MKLFLLFITIFLFSSAIANSYFFSTSTGDDSRSVQQAQNPATPWKTINKLNAFSNLNPGDLVLFKRGEIFYGSIPGSSGSIGSVITYDAYGSGANPIISGFTTLSGWTQHSGNIYYASLDVPVLHGVTLDGVVKGMGRYPNTGYLNYENHTNNTSITDNQLQGSPSWAGAEVVIRKYRWVIDRHIVTSHSGSTLNYNALATYGNNNAYSPVDGNGYFIQGHLGTLDTEGDWYYDKAAKRLYMHFGSGTPAGKTVKASTVNKLAWAGSYVSFNNLDFEGGNYAFSCEGNSNVSINNCNLKQQGSAGIYALNSNYITFNGGSVISPLNNGFWGEWDVNNVTINGVAFTNCAIIPGAGASGDGVYNGINISGSNNTFTNNTVSGVGYNGIAFVGNNILVENNFVEDFCSVKDDGGGIYTVISSSGVTASNRIIRGNVVLNAIGAYAGSEAYSYEAYGKAAAIYLDDFTNNVSVTGNTLAHGPWGGIFNNGGTNNSITNNLVYDFAQQLLLNAYTGRTVRNLSITGNQFIAKTASQKTMYIQLWLNESPALWGTFNNNYYARPVDDIATITVDRQYSGGSGASNISLATWKSTYGQDVASNKSPVAITSNPDQNILFQYNSTNAVKTIPITGNYVDVKNNKYSNNVSLQPYSSIVLLKSSTQGSSPNDKFRSKINGNWNEAASWQSSPDDITWIDATISPTRDANSITIQNGHSLDITDSVTIDQLFIDNGAVLNIAPSAVLIVDDGAGEDITIAASGKMIIKSNSAGTGRVGNSRGTIKGSVTVERYIPAHANARYQLLSSSVNTSTTIKSNWQEGTNNTGISTNNNPAPGYGTHITGSSTGANGFDATVTGQASLFTYMQPALQQGWTNIINTDVNTLDGKKGYLLYVRGNRSFDIGSNSMQGSNTTLRATGNLLMGTVTYLAQESNGRISLIANPYASPVNWKNLQATNSSYFENYYTLWDPNIGLRGGYVTVDVTGTKSVITSEATTEIQSGQAFMVKSKAGVTSPTFTIHESHKSTTNNINVFRSSQTIEKLYASLFFRNTAQNRILADGVLARFEENYAVQVNGDDAEDIVNFDENIALVRDGKMLSIESLPLSNISDTLFLKMNNLKQQAYEWQFNAVDFNSSQLKQAFVRDNYMGTETPIALTGATIIDFTVTSNPASAAVNRFTIIFKTGTALSVNILSLKGYKKNTGIYIEWETAKEINMDRYEVERSSDMQTFISKSVIAAKNSSITNSYNWFDSKPEKGNNFYRVRAISKDGTIRYSLVVSIFIAKEGEGMSVYPNPVSGKVFNVQLNNIAKGTYMINLINGIGQIIGSHKLEHPGGSATHSITANNTFIPGKYTMQLTGENTTLLQQILKQ